MKHLHRSSAAGNGLTKHPDYSYSNLEILAHYILAGLTLHEGGTNLELLIPIC